MKESYKYDSSGIFVQVISFKKVASKKNLKNYFKIEYDEEGRESNIHQLNKPKKKSK